MDYRLISKYLGAVAFIIGVSMFFSLPWAFEAAGGHWETEKSGFFGLVLSIVICFITGALLRYLGSSDKKLPLRKEAIAIVGMSWILATFLATLPYLISRTCLAPGQPMTVADAIFETQSGLSTTGASVISELEDPNVIPRTILFWRHTTTFLGGLGVMILFIALLGQGVSSKTLFRIERSPISNASPDVRVRQSASALMKTYLSLNFILTVILMFLGLSFFDAVCHSFSTIATGGFSTYNLSIGHFAAVNDAQAPLIEWIITIFMFLGGTNLLLLYWCFIGKPGFLFKNIEWRTYVVIVLTASLLVFTFGLFHKNDYTTFHYSDLQQVQKAQTVDSGRKVTSASDEGVSDPVKAKVSPETMAEPQTKEVPWYTVLRTSFFHVVSLMTSTGFCTAQYDAWESNTLFVLLLVMLIGGCSGSTAGGSKVIRWIIGAKGIRAELEHSFRPSVVRSLKVGDTSLEKETVSSIFAFLLVYLLAIILLAFLLILVEPDRLWETMQDPEERKMIDLFSASLSCVSNIGPGLGLVGSQGNYGSLSSLSKLFLSFGMLLGRLELYIILVFFTPSFWRQR